MIIEDTKASISNPLIHMKEHVTTKKRFPLPEPVTLLFCAACSSRERGRYDSNKDDFSISKNVLSLESTNPRSIPCSGDFRLYMAIVRNRLFCRVVAGDIQTELLYIGSVLKTHV